MRILLSLLLCLFTVPALANVFVWSDQETGLTVDFPDHWTVVHNQKPDDILTISAPGSNYFAGCRLRVRDDKRFVLYPRRYDAGLQRSYVSRDFWDAYLGDYSGAVLNRVSDMRGFAGGPASRADMVFIDQTGSQVLRRGFAFASLQNGEMVIFECSSDYQVYEQFYPVFNFIMQSVYKNPQEPVTIHDAYRPFLKDPSLKVHNARPMDLYSY